MLSLYIADGLSGFWVRPTVRTDINKPTENLAVTYQMRFKFEV